MQLWQKDACSMSRFTFTKGLFNNKPVRGGASIRRHDTIYEHCWRALGCWFKFFHDYDDDDDVFVPISLFCRLTRSMLSSGSCCCTVAVDAKHSWKKNCLSATGVKSSLPNKETIYVQLVDKWWFYRWQQCISLLPYRTIASLINLETITFSAFSLSLLSLSS